MSNNPILDDLHATRRKLLEESGGTLAGLVARLQANQKTSGRTILPTRPNRVLGEPLERPISKAGARTTEHD